MADLARPLEALGAQSISEGFSIYFLWGIYVHPTPSQGLSEAFMLGASWKRPKFLSIRGNSLGTFRYKCDLIYPHRLWGV